MKRDLSPLEKFLTTDDETRFELLKDPATKTAAETWMGPAAFQEFISHRPDSGHLGAGPKNIVFAPGVMGSTLQSNGLGGVWWLDMVRARDKLNQLSLTTDGSGDIDPDADVRPGAVDLSYGPFRKAIAMSRNFGGSVHFPYDWRKSMCSSAALLCDTVLSTYSDYGERVHLVGHSMGGLMIRTALMLHDQEMWPKVGRIVFIGTPHYGSTSIAGYLKNHLWGWEEIAILAMFLSRETFRTLRGVLSLLPSPAGIYPGTRSGEEHPCANFDMYDASAWKLDLDAGATVHLQNALDEVRQFHTDLYQWHDALAVDRKERMLMIAGVGQETLFRLEFDRAFWGLWERTSKFTNRIPGNPNREGDGRVPLASALLEDVTTRFVKGEHGGLPNIPSVAQDVLAWLMDDKLKLPDTPEGALSQHLDADEGNSAAPVLDGSGVKGRFRDLPQYERPTAAFQAQIASELDAGKLPQVNLVKIL